MERADEPESYAGLVQALRVCGLLGESLAAHERATALDPAIVTSVTHTHFLRGDYHATIDTYSGTRYYLDAAARAALDDVSRALSLLRERLSSGPLSSNVIPNCSSIWLAIARWLSATADAIDLLRRARSGGFTSSRTLERDEAFASVRRHADFQREVAESVGIERATRRELERHQLHQLVRQAE